MKISMNNQDLLEGLNTVTRALAARPTKQILEGVLISAVDDRVTLTCSDGSLFIEYTNAADIEEEGQAVLPGRLFTDLIRKLPGGQVELKVQNQRQAQIKCQKTRGNLAVMSADEFPEIGHMKSGIRISIPSKKLKEMITHVVFAIATDESRPILTGCLLEVSRTEARLVALDGFRLAMQKVFQPFDLPENRDIVKVIIPGKVLTEMSRILPDDDAFCTMLIDQGRMECHFSNITLCSVLLAGEFIDYRRILPASFKTQARTDRISVQDAIDRATIMAREGKNNLIKMSLRQGVMKISSNAEMGDVEEEVETDLIGDNIDIAFNARYLIDVIRNDPEDLLFMHFNSNVSPCVVMPQSGDAFLYLILPVRVFQ